MNRLPVCVTLVWCLCAPACVGLPTVSAQPGGLYGDETTAKTGGDLNDQDYWRAKFDAMMLEIALTSKQPDGVISIALATSMGRMKELAAKYPNHEDIKKWLARAQEVQAKLDPNANRGSSFNPGCPWDESNFEQLWVNLQWAQMLVADKEWDNATAALTNVMPNYSILMQPGRMKDYPEDLRKWVVEHRVDANRLWRLVQSKTSPPTLPAVRGADVTGGELNDQDYWYAAFDMMMLDRAIKAHQPEGTIGVALGASIRRLTELEAAYPHHQQIAEWKKRAENIQDRINPDADRGRPFGPECPWDESNLVQLWVNFHWAKTAHAVKDDEKARGAMAGVMPNLEILLQPGRMKNMPDDLREWVTATKVEAQKLDDLLRGK